MRLSAIFAAFLLSLLFSLVNERSANALTPASYFKQPPLFSLEEQLYLPPAELNTEPEETTQSQPAAEAPQISPAIIHRVQAGDSLSTIAEKYETTWQRLYFKNRSIQHPDKLTIGTRLVVPDADEQLRPRDIPLLQPMPVPATQPIITSTPLMTGGNTYFYGYCTWYAKNRRPDLPNNLGNADTWTVRAATQGYATGSLPRVGAIAQQGMHVAYVEAVHKDGTITVSEMNFVGWNVVSQRRTTANSFSYIY